MAVKRREWITAKGEERSAWVVDYYDSNKKRRLKTFKLKKDADAFSAGSRIQLLDGTHVADRASVTVEEAAKLWIEARTADGRERTTLDQYRNHANLHINPFIGQVRLNGLTVPSVRGFEETLRENGRSQALVRKILVSLGSILSDAQERGLVAHNPVRDMRVRRSSAADKSAKRAKKKLKVGEDIPTPEEVKLILRHLTGRWRPPVITALFSGMRSSEIRGLRWPNVDLDKLVVHVRERTDRYNETGRPKSASSDRSIPIPPMLAEELRAWKKHCPKSENALVFPNTEGGFLNHTQLTRDGWGVAQVKAGVSVPGKDRAGKPIMAPKYSGLHATRHFYASWCINRKRDGGLELPAKVVQERLGHSSIVLTLNTYSHLFPSLDTGEEMADAAAQFFGD